MVLVLHHLLQPLEAVEKLPGEVIGWPEEPLPKMVLMLHHLLQPLEVEVVPFWELGLQLPPLSSATLEHCPP